MSRGGRSKPAVSIVAAVLLVVAALVPLWTQPAAADTGASAPVAAVRPTADLSAFDPGDIIGDDVFFDGYAMTESEVQSFLNAKVSRCSSGYTCLKDWRGPSASQTSNAMCGAFEGSASETAASLIVKVARACGINPRVILVTMQKEQGLVLSSAPSAYAYNFAMGYNCPDTTGCTSNGMGFSTQVYGGAYMFKRYANPPGTSAYFTWYQPGKTWNVLYNPNTACGSSPVYIRNQATANLYYYTPYQPNAAALRAGYGTGDGCSSYGNRNFYNYFTDWFGTTHGFTVKPGSGIEAAYLTAGGASGYLGKPASNERCGLKDDGCFQLFDGGQIHWTPMYGGFATRGAVLGVWAASGYENGTLGYPTSNENCSLRNGGCVQLFQHGQIHWTNSTGAHITKGALLSYWASSGYENGTLGYPTTDEICGLRDGGCYQYFERGQVHWTAATGAHATAGAVKDAWGTSGWESGKLGYPVSDLVCVSDAVGCEQRFQGGTIAQGPDKRAYVVLGGVAGGWSAAGGLTGTLGAPTTSEHCGLQGGGCFQYFVGGQVHWSAATGGHATFGSVKDAWGQTGWEGGKLGYPTSGLTCISDAVGCEQRFQRGTIAYGADNRPTVVYAGVANGWVAAGGLSGVLGSPTSDEHCGLKDSGCFQYFAGGQVHWSASSGGHATYGKVKDAWGASGWENGKLGYPTSELVCGLVSDGCYQHFQNGDIHYSSGSPAVPTWGAIRNAWAAQGWENGRLGYPSAPEVCTAATSCSQSFTGGSIEWTAAGGARIILR